MSISGDYPYPINVNGFACRNCTDVGRAEKNIDPAHPQDGPFKINADKKDVQAKEHKRVFDRDRIDAAIAAAHRADKAAEAKTGQLYGSPEAAAPSGGLINLYA